MRWIVFLMAVMSTAGCRVGFYFCYNDADCDDGDPCTIAICEKKHCSNSTVPNCQGCASDAACDDGRFCTGQEFCRDGICQGSSNPCTAGECDEDDDRCAGCGDGTVNAGEDCDPGAPQSDHCCDVATCGWATAGFGCDDGVYCNGSDACDGAGACLHAGDPCGPLACDEEGDSCAECAEDGECEDGIDCTDDVCLGGACLASANNANCPDDGLFCNGTESCMPSEPGADPVTGCLSSGSPCLETECNRCNEGLQNCNDDAGTACGSAIEDSCTLADTCDGAGHCQGNHVVIGTDCDDGQYCSGTDTCDGAGSCQHQGDPCNAGEHCNDISDSCEQEFPAMVQLATGADHTCGLTPGGKAWCWGRDHHGQLGDGGTSNGSQSPVAVDTSGMTGETAFVQLVTGHSFSCGLTAEGAAWCWGEDGEGQLGDGGASADSGSPVAVDTGVMTGETAFVQLAAGSWHACGFTAEGRAWCWGADPYGQLGDGGVSGNSQVPVVVDTSPMTGETGFVDITAGAEHTCALTAAGRAWCWGEDQNGELGNGGGAVDSQVPVPVEVSGMTGETAFVGLAAGRDFSCGLTATGSAWCWGRDDMGQLGDGGDSSATLSPVAVDTNGMTGGKAFVQLSAGARHICGRTAEGVAWCWGWDNEGQLGNGGGTNDVQSPVAVDIGPVTGQKSMKWIAAGGSHTCGLTGEGAVWCWGDDADGQLGSGGDSDDSELPVAVDTSPMPGQTAFVQVETFGQHACALTGAGAAWCWGRGETGQLGTGGSPLTVQSPRAVDTSSMTGDTAFVQLSAGWHHTCGLVASGTAWCWGSDIHGQLGDGGASSNALTPVAVDTSSMIGETAFVQLVGGGDRNTCGLTAEGKAWCWGNNEYGQLGDEDVAGDAQVPVEVDISGMTGERAFIRLSHGRLHVCGLTGEGRVWCWGYDGYGQLGDGGASSDSPVPVEVNTLPMTPGETLFKEISSGSRFTCGLTSAGAAWCWGDDMRGQLGNGGVLDDPQSPSPVDTSPMSGEVTLVALAPGDYHACAVTARGLAWCWGYDEWGQLGDGGISSDSDSPVALDTTTMTGSTVISLLTAGQGFSCGLTCEGIGWCWGWDVTGNLGDGGSSQDAQSPVAVDTSPLE